MKDLLRRAGRPTLSRLCLVLVVLLLFDAIPAFPTAASELRSEIEPYPQVQRAGQPLARGRVRGAAPGQHPGLTRDSRVLFQYQAVRSPLGGTIGIENSDETLAQQVLCGGAGRQVRSGDALLMNPAVPW